MKSQRSKRQPESPLVHDERAFDVELVRSALRFHELWRAQQFSTADRRSLMSRVLAAAYGWLPPVMKARAAIAGVDEKAVEWVPGKYPFDAAQDAYVFIDLALPVIARELSTDVPVRIWRNDEKVREHGSWSEWLDQELRRLQIWERYRCRDGVISHTSVPLLNGARPCVAYGAALLLEDRWGLRERVVRCPYVAPGQALGAGEHYFLDYRLDSAGKLISGQRQRFCSPSHSNAFRQRQYRARLTDRRGRSAK